MANILRITSTGEIVIGSKTLKISDLVFKASNDVVDIDGNSVLNRSGLVDLTTFNLLVTSVNDNSSDISTKANITDVNDLCAVKADMDKVILKSDLSSIQTTPPALTGPTMVNENSETDFTITNYNSAYVYDVIVSEGSYVLAQDKITYTAPNVSNATNKDITINVSAVETGKLKSNLTQLTVTVSYVDMTADQMLSNADYEANAVYNDKFQY